MSSNQPGYFEVSNTSVENGSNQSFDPFLAYIIRTSEEHTHTDIPDCR